MSKEQTIDAYDHVPFVEECRHNTIRDACACAFLYADLVKREDGPPLIFLNLDDPRRHEERNNPVLILDLPSAVRFNYLLSQTIERARRDDLW